MEIKRKVAIIIPCYKAKDSIGSVVEKCLIYLEKIRENFTYKIIIIDDACPQRSCENIKDNMFIKLIQNKVPINHLEKVFQIHVNCDKILLIFS